MLIRLKSNEPSIDAIDVTITLHGELPTPGSVIEIGDLVFAVAAVPTTWICKDDELIPVLHILPKLDSAQL